jgi:predicted permease
LEPDGLALPAAFDWTLGFIGHAAAPSALFALGATLSLRRLGGSLGPAAAMIAAKLGLHPLLAFLAFDWLLGLDRLWVNAGRDLRRLPVGLNVYVFVRPALRGRERHRLQPDPDLDRARDADDHLFPAAPAAGHALISSSVPRSLRAAAMP